MSTRQLQGYRTVTKARSKSIPGRRERPPCHGPCIGVKCPLRPPPRPPYPAGGTDSCVGVTITANAGDDVRMARGLSTWARVSLKGRPPPSYLPRSTTTNRMVRLSPTGSGKLPSSGGAITGGLRGVGLPSARRTKSSRPASTASSPCAATRTTAKAQNQEGVTPIMYSWDSCICGVQGPDPPNGHQPLLHARLRVHGP